MCTVFFILLPKNNKNSKQFWDCFVGIPFEVKIRNKNKKKTPNKVSCILYGNIVFVVDVVVDFNMRNC